MAADQSRELTLGEVVKALAAKLHNQEVPLPFRDQEKWHQVFYKLKQSNSEKRPQFLAELSFNWDGPYPRSEELSDFINAMHFTASVAGHNPKFEVISLSQDRAQRWLDDLRDIDESSRHFIDHAAELAAAEFTPNT